MRLEAPSGNTAFVRKDRAHEARVRPVGRHLDVGDRADRKKHEAVGAHQVEVHFERHPATGGIGGKRHAEPVLEPAQAGAQARLQSRGVDPYFRYRTDAARIRDAKHHLGSRLPYQLPFVRDAEPWRQREPGDKTGSRPEHGHAVDPALPRLDMYLGTDRQRIRKQDLGALPDLPGLTLQSRRHTLAIAHNDEGANEGLALGRALRDFGRYVVAIARTLPDHVPNQGERHDERYGNGTHDKRLQQHVRPHTTDPPVQVP